MSKHGTASQVSGSYIRDVAGSYFREVAGNAYPVIVNYGMSVEDAVKLGRYDWANADISSRNFPTTRTGKVDLTIELVHFGLDIKMKYVLRELDKGGVRPAELHELLAFGEKYPEVLREFPVVALGSVWQYRDSRHYVPYLSRCCSKRDLNLFWFGPNWGGSVRFAVVRK